MDSSRKELIDFLRHSVASIIGRGANLTEGYKFGVELELEGRRLGGDGAELPRWQAHIDGSVPRGIEWVLIKPLVFEDTLKAVDELWDSFKNWNTVIDNSYRTSTHIHLNFSDKRVADVINFFVLFTIFEEVLTTYCGDNRKGNFFCLGAREAEAIVSMMEESIERSSFRHTFGDNVRYGAMNLNALSKFGSIEIRTMRGIDKKEELVEWLHILNRLYEYACKTDNPPSNLLESLSFLGPKGFMESVFGPDLTKILTQNYSEIGLHQSLYEGLRLVQMLCYSLFDVWEEAKKSNIILPSVKKMSAMDEYLRAIDPGNLVPPPRGGNVVVPNPVRNGRPRFAADLDEDI